LSPSHHRLRRRCRRRRRTPDRTRRRAARRGLPARTVGAARHHARRPARIGRRRGPRSVAHLAFGRGPRARLARRLESPRSRSLASEPAVFGARACGRNDARVARRRGAPAADLNHVLRRHGVRRTTAALPDRGGHDLHAALGRDILANSGTLPVRRFENHSRLAFSVRSGCPVQDDREREWDENQTTAIRNPL